MLSPDLKKTTFSVNSHKNGIFKTFIKIVMLNAFILYFMVEMTILLTIVNNLL